MGVYNNSYTDLTASLLFGSFPAIQLHHIGALDISETLLENYAVKKGGWLRVEGPS